MDTAVGSKVNIQELTPKLRKNRNIESKWGMKYFAAVKNAVFNIQPAAYMPSEPPTSLTKDLSQTNSLYVCRECKDCFRFQSSFEEHTARRSWILGFWCQHCFVTICTHMPTERSPCFTCLKLDRDKRSYLRSRGRRKSQKLGAARVFYNQCQFFAHLKSHSITSVDMSELMLMPLPTNICSDWSPQLDIACEALMEHAFLCKVHIMDWLKDKRVENHWWQLATTKMGVNKCNFDDPVTRVLKGYKGRIFFSSSEICLKEHSASLTVLNSTTEDNPAVTEVEVIENTENSKKKHDSSIETMVSDSDQIEREDNPCMATDIAFVDCGPTSKCFEPESPVNSVARKHTTIFIKASQDSPNVYQPANIVKLNSKRKKLKAITSSYNSASVALSYGNTTITPKPGPMSSSTDSADVQLRKDATHRYTKGKVPIKIITESNTNKVAPTTCIDSSPSLVSNTTPMVARKSTCQPKLEKLQQKVPTLTINSGKKIMTVQGPTNIDFTKIINQLPPQLVNSRRIVLIGQEAESVSSKSLQEQPAKKLIQVVPDTALGKGVTTLQTKLVSLHVSNDIKKEIGHKLQSDATVNKEQSPATKIIYRNGRKYVVKAAASTSKSLANIPDLTPIASLPKQTSPESNLSTTVSANLVEPESNSISEKTTGLQNDVSPLTPSPSPSELSSSSSCDTQSKQTPIAVKGVHKSDPPIPQLIDSIETAGNLFSTTDSSENLSFRKGEDDNLYLNVKFFSQKPIQNISDTCIMITKCKQEMLNEFFYLSNAELKRRMDHLQQVNDEIITVLNFVADNVIQEKLKAVNILQRVLKHCMDKCNDDAKEINDGDRLLNDWESEFECSKEKMACTSCGKTIKPKTYIPGFSKLARDDEAYCFCYKHICHKCLTYQGNVTRFIAHRKFHEKEEPFVCPDCSRKFSSFKMLEVHSWTVCFHTLKRRVFGCKICEIEGFRDMESIARHFAIMHSHNRIVCGVCYVVLPSYADYKKHIANTHPYASNHEPIRLVLCKLGQCIVRCENFMLHMEKHLVVNRLLWFKCPFCSFINLEAKRIMSHFQSKHLQRLPEILSIETLMDILPSELALKLKANLELNTSTSKFVNARAEPCEDGTVIPKIINTRTITSEVFERGAEEEEQEILPDNKSVCLLVSPKSWNNSGTEATECKADEIKIVDCHTDKVEGDTLPRILNVRSIADVSSPKLNKDAETESAMASAIEEKAKEGAATVGKQMRKQTKAVTVESGKVSSVNELSTKGHDSETKSAADAEKSASDSSEESSSVPEHHTTPKLGGTITILSPALINRASSTRLEKDRSARNEGTDCSNKTDRSSTNRSSETVKTMDVQDLPVENPEEKKAGEEEQKKEESRVEDRVISQPPPLTRISQQLSSNETKKTDVQETGTVKDRSAIHPTRSYRSSRQTPYRIALNRPVDSTGKILNFSCHLCSELINTSWSVISAHYKEKHKDDHKLVMVSPKLLRIDPEFINGGYKDLLSNKKRKPEPIPIISKRRRRWTPKKHAEQKSTSSPGLGLCVEKETAEDGEGNFRCKKCDQRCTDMGNLREHIASNHRINTRNLICLECGENFVVAPSLQMHLKAFHGIEDPITYMSQNTLYAPDSVDDYDVGGKTAVANQCYVCMAVFESKAAVDKHLRVHGMAFLNRRMIEARNALKSPEKPSRTEETPEKVTKESLKESVKPEKPIKSILDRISASI